MDFSIGTVSYLPSGGFAVRRRSRRRLSKLATSIASAVSTGSIDPGRWRSLAVVLSAAFLVTLDFFVADEKMHARASALPQFSLIL